MNTQIIIEQIDRLAQKLGVSVAYIWPLFVRQQYVEALFSAIVMAIVLSLAMLSVGKFMDAEKEQNESLCFIFGILSIVLAIASLVTCIVFFDEVKDVFNPEYAAMKDILNSLRLK